MPVDPFAVLRALLRAEAARNERVASREPERAPVRESEPAPAPLGKEHRTR
ncbi:hypothetical protein M5362_08485 [Streptomyces sp. Je 1-79]|uniref:hypothetical protein n=1 Tax=Streptomyces sp. Je 1-79 TaxID=2943847 RepID=UPI0021A5814F|nr:hypothetical protein [Streptomyces sp. Je 1-79]MCT4353165.1 hypothetical protein [Streptomyces sp. Je 1-79]